MKKTFFSGCRDAVCGFFMSPVDSVPGVSGGTVAFFAGLKFVVQKRRASHGDAHEA